jgi:acyl-CoA synthetase (AMP-forming)/AMP-acid ligase II
VSNLIQGIAETASRFPHKPAIVENSGNSISFQQLGAGSARVSSALRSQGVSSGDRVILISANSIDAVLLGLGVFRLGASLVWLDERRSGKELAAIAQHADPKVAVVAETNLRLMVDAEKAAKSPVLPLKAIVSKDPGNNHDAELLTAGNEDIATIVYTSGSSGSPKGVCLTHSNLESVARAVISHMPITSSDSYLMLVPIHYVHGLMQLFVHLLAGATIYLGKGFHFPRLIAEQIRDSGVSGFSGVPYHFTALMEHSGLLEMSLPQLKWVTSTGGFLAPSAIAKFRSALPNVNFHIAYGQSECSPRATALQPQKIDAKPDSVGAPIPGVQVYILSEDGEELPVGDVGEVVVEGPNVMLGYWRNEEATAAVIDEKGRLHTGDLGHVDEDGDLFLVGRISDIIKSAGERISASQVESILLANRRVVEAVACGSPDKTYGEILVANVCLQRDLNVPGIDEAIEDLHSDFLSKETFARAPRVYVVWEELPRLANSKYDRQGIAKALEQGSTGNPYIVKIVRPGYID